jgi:hypothetical protein
MKEMAGTVLPAAMRYALRVCLVPLQAAKAFRNGPANEMRMNETMRAQYVIPSTAIRHPFSRTVRRPVSAFEDSDSL